METKTIFNIILTLLFLASVGYILYNLLIDRQDNIKLEFYNKGVFNGQLELVQKINQEARIPILSFNNQTNQSSINWVDLRVLCGGSR